LKFVRRSAALAIVFAAAIAFATIALAVPTKPAHPSAPAANGTHTTTAPGKPAPAKPEAGDDTLDRVDATVNDEAVWASEVDEQLKFVLDQMQQNGTPPNTVAEIDTLRRQVLDQMIDEKLRQEEAKRLGIVVTDAELIHPIDTEIENARHRLGGEEAFQKQLQHENLTEAQLREKYRGDLRKQIAGDRLKAKQFPPRTVSQAEAEDYFKKNKDKFPHVAAEVHVKVIQITPEPESAAVAATLARIKGLRKRVTTGGERFEQVAKEVTEDPALKQRDGDLGIVADWRQAVPLLAATLEAASRPAQG